MAKWKVGDVLVSSVTYYATQYVVTDTYTDNSGKQSIEIAVDGHGLHSRFGSDLFEIYTPAMTDTRDYLDVITSDVERTENEIS